MKYSDLTPFTRHPELVSGSHRMLSASCIRWAVRRDERSRARATTPLLTSQSGFTIVELMIATVVFSTVLMIITFGVLHFSSSYYKGINSSATQTAAQNAIDTISQGIQFGTAASVGADSSTDPNGVFCAGTKLFLYYTGVKYAGPSHTPSLADGTTLGLYMINNPASDCTVTGLTDADLKGGVELLGTGMRLTNISVFDSSSATNLWQISLGVAYGDDDLLCNTGQNGSTGGCSKGDPLNTTGIISGDDVTCKAQIGSQFCSVASLSTVAQQRITGG